jgi:hypothetical protein
MRPAIRTWLTALALVASATHAWAGEGVQPQNDPHAWERLKARLALGTTTVSRNEQGANESEAQKINSVSLMGDYYLSRPWLGTSGGWRATSGVLLGSRGAAWSSPSLLDRRSSGAADNADSSTLPYLGLGYTGWSSKGGWGLSADLGLMGSPRSAARFGKAGAGTQSLDDTVRDLRFSPTVQLGLSYSF